MQELERFKREINIAEYASSVFGYVLDRKKSTKISKVLKREGDTIVVSKDKNDGHYIYFSPTGGDSGTIIDFVQHRTGENLGQIRKRLREYMGEPSQYDIAIALSSKDEREVAQIANEMERKWEEIKKKAQPYPLGSLRGIPDEIIENGAVYSDGRIYFALRAKIDGQWRIVGIESREGLDGRSARLIEGSKKGIYLHGRRRAPAKIIITESTIDALSAQTMAGREDYLYISTGGNIGEYGLKQILAVAEENRGAEIVIATDNDEAGERLADTIAERLKERGIEANRYYPDGKDLNEDLLATIAWSRRKKRRRSYEMER